MPVLIQFGVSEFEKIQPSSLIEEQRTFDDQFTVHELVELLTVRAINFTLSESMFESAGQQRIGLPAAI